MLCHLSKKRWIIQAYLFILVLSHVGLELEVGIELARTELTLVGAVDQDYLLAFTPSTPFVCCHIKVTLNLIQSTCSQQRVIWVHQGPNSEPWQ